MDTQNYQYLFKIVIIGNSGVGKTCFLSRYTDETFQNNYISTIGVDFKIKTIKINDESVKLQLWDTAGQERFSAITKSYYRGAHGIIVIFDLTNKKSFQSLKDWFKKINDDASADCEIMLLGNKSDLENNFEVEDLEIDKFLGEEKRIHPGRFYKVSAKENTKVNDAFETLTRILVEKTKKVGVIGSKEKGMLNFSSYGKNKGCC